MAAGLGAAAAAAAAVGEQPCTHCSSVDRLDFWGSCRGCAAQTDYVRQPLRDGYGRGADEGSESSSDDGWEIEGGEGDLVELTEEQLDKELANLERGAAEESVWQTLAPEDGGFEAGSGYFRMGLTIMSASR